ncbi:hypothetical protein BGZ79_001985 [Entomortierella chlamydospora]|nr:hypothetical protein BGZ79_001985 [Entomortierella chlamydospora]
MDNAQSEQPTKPLRHFSPDVIQRLYQEYDPNIPGISLDRKRKITEQLDITLIQINGWVKAERKRRGQVAPPRQDRQMNAVPPSAIDFICDWTSDDKDKIEKIFQKEPTWRANSKQLVQEADLNVDQAKEYWSLRRAEERYLERTGAVVRADGERLFSAHTETTYKIPIPEDKYEASWFYSRAIPSPRTDHPAGAVCLESYILTSTFAACPLHAINPMDGIFAPDNQGRFIPHGAGKLSFKQVQLCVPVILEDGRILFATASTKVVTLQGMKSVSQLTIDDSIATTFSGVREVDIDLKLDLSRWNETSTSNRSLQDVPCFTASHMILDSDTQWRLQEDKAKILAFARILGYVITDGHISATYASKLALGSLIDYGLAASDLYTIVSYRPKTPPRFQDSYTGGCYVLSIPFPLSRWLAKATGESHIGRKTAQPSTIPTILLGRNVPLAFIQAFLGGMFGGDGCSPGSNYSQDTACRTISFVKSTNSKYSEQLVRFMHFIGYLLYQGFNIRSTRISCKSSARQGSTFGKLDLLPVDNISFGTYIGFRNCTSKMLRCLIDGNYQSHLFIVGLCRATIIESFIHGIRELDQKDLPLMQKLRDTRNILSQYEIIQLLQRIGDVDIDDLEYFRLFLVKNVSQKYRPTAGRNENSRDKRRRLGGSLLEGNRHISEQHEMHFPPVFMKVMAILPPVQRQVAQLSSAGAVVNGVGVIF